MESRETCRTHRSLPLVYGTMQNEHRLLHPRMIDRNAPTLPEDRTGVTSAYVSSTLSWTLMACWRREGLGLGRGAAEVDVEAWREVWERGRDPDSSSSWMDRGESGESDVVEGNE